MQSFKTLKILIDPKLFLTVVYAYSVCNYSNFQNYFHVLYSQVKNKTNHNCMCTISENPLHLIMAYILGL